MTDIRYIQSTERQVGEAHPTLSDTLNRALRDVLTGSGLDPDADFGGFTTGPSGTGSPEGAVTADVGQIYRQTDGANGTTLWMKNSGTGNTGWRPFQTSLGVFNVKDFGAKGDGTTDDTAAIQAAVTAAAGGVVHFPPASYKLTSALSVAAATTLYGPGATLTQATNSVAALALTASDIIVDGLTVVGPGGAASTPAAGSIGISATGTSNASPLSGIVIRNCAVRGFNMQGILLIFCVESVVHDTAITDCAYSGISLRSTHRTLVHDNLIDTIGTASSALAYGVTLGRTETDSLTTDPGCDSCVVSGNLVRNVPGWEGLDTHAGTNVLFVGNRVEGCNVGIAVVPSDDSTETTIFSPSNVVVCNNIVDSGVTDGTTGAGISVSGATSTLLADGIVVQGNTILNHGNDANLPNHGAIILLFTRGLRVQGNTLQRPSPVGIVAYQHNYGAILSGNMVVDAWSALFSAACAIRVSNQNNVVLVADNAIRRADQTATYVNIVGCRIDSTSTGNRITYGRNDFTDATTPYTNVGSSTVLGSESVSGDRGDADVTLQVGVDAETQRFATTLTANRTITLSTTGAYDGARFRVIRSGLGKFTLDVGGLVTLPTGMAMSADMVYRAGWKLTAVMPMASGPAWAAKTTTYTVTGADDGLFLGGTTWTLTLQDAASRKRPLYLRCTASGTVTISRAGSDTIEGGTSLNMVAGERMTLMPNGTDWLRVD